MLCVCVLVLLSIYVFINVCLLISFVFVCSLINLGVCLYCVAFVCDMCVCGVCVVCVLMLVICAKTNNNHFFHSCPYDFLSTISMADNNLQLW